MKYLIQNKKEFIITLGVFVTFAAVLFWSIWSIIKGTFDMTNLLAIIGSIIEYFGWYFNMPTSEENCKYTGLMRVEKMVNKNKEFIGENFFDEHDIWDEGDLEDIDDDDDIEVVECEEQPEDAHDDEVIDDEL